MPGSPADHFRQIPAVLLKLRRRNIPQRTGAGHRFRQDCNGLFALRAPAIVFASCMLMLDHGVADYQAGRGRKWQLFELQRAAVDHEAVRFFAQTGDELVHDANPRTNEFVLGALTQFGEID